MALPRLRPLELIPVPFGQEWSLLPPNISFRTELKALYAAMLHTFCIESGSVHAMCQWGPSGNDATSAAASAAIAAEAPPTPIIVPLAKPEAASTMASAVPASMPPPSTRRHVIAGSVCALSGVALLGWLALSHSPTSKTVLDTPASDTVPSATTGQPESHADRMSGSVVTAQALPAPASASTQTAKAAKAAAPGKSVLPLAPTTTVAVAPAPVSPLTPTAPEATQHPAQPQSQPLTQAKAAQLAKPRSTHASNRVKKSATLAEQPSFRTDTRAATRMAARAPHHTDKTRGKTRHDYYDDTYLAAPHKIHRNANVARWDVIPDVTDSAYIPPRAMRHAEATSTYSAAGPYSPPPPAPLMTNSYPSVALSANTQASSPPPPLPRTNTGAAARAPSGAAGSDWMQSISQRRVTEIPDQFAK